MKKEIEAMPVSREAENSILGCILLNGEESFDRVLPWIRSDEAFYTNDNKKIWKAIKILRQKKDPIDLVTVSNILREEGEDKMS